MKKSFFFLATCWSCLSFATPLQDRTIDRQALSELALRLDIPPTADLVAETQKRWLRKPGQERWEQTELSSEQRAFVIDWAEKQGLFVSWQPAEQTYDQALILGATTSRMGKRLEYLKQLWVQGIRFQKVVWLTGERPLDARVDGLIDRCQTEADAARVLWEEADLPAEMSLLPVSFVAVPMKREGKRPNTADTLIAWLKTTAPCKALFISDQPFCGYQFSVINSCLPQSFLFDVVGPGIDPTNYPTAAATTLDSIARWLYQENL